MIHSLPRPTFLLAAGLCALGLACASSPAPSAQPDSSIFTHPPAAGEAQLYARDGSVVGAQGALDQGAVNPARREVAGAESGRMYLLELYQQVIDERDSLSREVHALRADIEALNGAQGKSQARVIELEQRAHTLETEQQRLQAENLDLAARLTTAQIRRLQAERLLLEHKLAEQRARETTQSADAGTKGQHP